MTKEQTLLLQVLIQNSCTDSDIEDFCESNKVDIQEAFHLAAELHASPECKDCRHIELYPRMYPCNSCRRGFRDMFEKI